MGFLYIKVIESRKVAIRTSFFVNYPFIRLKLNKEQKSTNFKPGVEWWDKILSFKIPKEYAQNLSLIVQARDKSIHVFRSDWIGEVSVELKDMCDGLVHQKWFKFGKGVRTHNRAPRGYVHLAFQYMEEGGRERPFAELPVERVYSFEEWLAVEDTERMEDYERIKSRISSLRASMESEEKSHSVRDSIRASNEDMSSVVRDRHSKEMKSSPSDSLDSEEESESDFKHSDEDVDTANIPTANLIDLSFDSPSSKSNKSSNLSRSSGSSPSLASSTQSAEDLSSKPTNPFSTGWYNEFASRSAPSMSSRC